MKRSYKELIGLYKHKIWSKKLRLWIKWSLFMCDVKRTYYTAKIVYCVWRYALCEGITYEESKAELEDRYYATNGRRV